MAGRKGKKKDKKQPKDLTQMISEKQYERALGGAEPKKYKVLETTKPLWGIVEFDLNSPVEEEEPDGLEDI